MNRWDSPWLNPKFLIGFGMVLLVASMSVIGPMIWDTDLSRVASSPLNLPPAWVGGSEAEAASGAAPAATATTATAATTDEGGAEATAVETPATAERSGNSITGGNPLAQQQAAPTAEENRSSGSSITGGNPLAQQQPASTPQTSGSVTGGNPFANQQSAAADTDANAEATATPRSLSNATQEQLAQRRASSAGRFGTPTWDHPLGTESSGRDMLAVLLVGAPRSLWIGIIAAGIGMLVGILLGFTAGFVGGWVDTVIRTLSDAFITIPSLAVLIVISAFVSFNNITYMALMLALFAWPGPTRLLRSQVLSMRERGYVQMAQLSGASVFSIMFFEMMPNLLPYLAASFTGNVSGAILAATGLETLGLGPTRVPTLGITIFYAIRAAAILRGMWWWWGVPIVALILIFTGLFLMTVGLDEIANPRLRGAKTA
jgi:peptide/nickel transport system permease protein